MALLISVLLPERLASRFRLTSALFSFLGEKKSQVSALFNRTGYLSLFLIGLLNGLLPCGFVYTGLAGAVLTGGSLTGALFMMTFGLGTLPAMAVLSLAGSKVGPGFRSRLRKTMPACILVMALLLVFRGLNLGIPYLSPKLSSSDWTQHVCCHKK